MRAIAAGLWAALLVGCATNPGPIPLGGGAFNVTREAASGFGGVTSVKADALREANAFCEAKGQEMQAIDVRTNRPPYIFANFPRAEVDFRCASK